MIYIGNDIISLNDKKNIKSFTNPRYINKICSKTEINSLNRSQHREYLPFLYWTCKESAYKVLVKKGLRLAFCPVNYLVKELHYNHHDSSFYCLVSYRKQVVFTRSFVKPNYVHTIACNTKNALDSINYHEGEILLRDMKDQSSFTRNLIVDNIAPKLHINKSGINFSKSISTGAPSVHIEQYFGHIDISLSHDAEFISCAYLLSKPVSCYGKRRK